MLIDKIVVGQRLRAANEDAVQQLVESITQLGMQTPITVRVDDAGAVRLVAGLQRLEACKRLGLTEIACAMFDGSETQARCWEISENLARHELSATERFEHTAMLLELTQKETGAPMRQVERSLNIEHGESYRARKVAALAPEIRQQAREENWSGKRLLDTATNKPRLVASDTAPKASHRVKDPKEGSREPRDTELSRTRRQRRDQVQEVYGWLSSRLGAEELRQLSELLVGICDERLLVALRGKAAA